MKVLKYRSALLLALLFTTCGNLSIASDKFSWHDTEGLYMDLKWGEQPIIRYQYEAIDTSSAQRRHDTYKPFHHIFAPDGKHFITKGPGGKFTHHRGIYYGFSKCSFTDNDGKKHTNNDTWHCKKAHQIHREILKAEASETSATITSRISWISNSGIEFANEERTLTFSHNHLGDLLIDFHSKLIPTVPSMTVDGDPQHAGFQFRANNEVASNPKQTYYIRPKTGKAEMGTTINWSGKNDTEATRDLPWKVMSFTTGKQRYSVLYIDNADNPKPARYSEREYGRFGSYFKKDNITAEQPLEVNYSLLIRTGEFDADQVEELLK